jgi:hypothetical protein
MEKLLKMKETPPYLLCVLTFLFWVQPSYAYLEPGNGYILLQALAAGFAGVIALLRIYWQKIKLLWKRQVHRIVTDNKHDHSPH